MKMQDNLYNMTFDSLRFTEQLRRAVEVESAKMSEEMLWAIQTSLWDIISFLRSAVNLRQPLLTLPAEILDQILQEIPIISQVDTQWKLEPFWYPSFRDSSHLVSVSRTCRRLRTHTLSRSSWWSHIHTRDDHSIPSLILRSGVDPLNVVVSNPSSAMTNLRTYYVTATVRMRELHFFNVEYEQMRPFRPFLQLFHPDLESLSLCRTDETDSRWKRHKVTLTDTLFPVLRHLVFHGVAFRVSSPLPSLTHLILSSIRMPNLRGRVFAFVCACPSLVNLVLSRLLSEDDPIIEDSEPANSRLPNLRRVYLHDLDSQSLQYYLSFNQQCADRYALQVVNDIVPHDRFKFDTVLSEQMPDMAQTLELSIIHSGAHHHRFSLTAASLTSAVRISSTGNLIRSSHYRDPGAWFERMLTNHSTLYGVRELWLSAASAQRADWFTYIALDLRTVFRALPKLEIVVIVTINSPSLGTPYFPDLYPFSSLVDNPSSNHSYLKMLRLVHCITPDTQATADGAVDIGPGLKKLGLSRMLERLASSSYCYFEELLLQSTPHFQVDESEIASLKEYFKKVTVEKILEVPQMPLPQVCVRPDDGPGGSCTWTTSLC